jgi:hypothetical protein
MCSWCHTFAYRILPTVQQAGAASVAAFLCFVLLTHSRQWRYHAGMLTAVETNVLQPIGWPGQLEPVQ